MMHRLPGLGYTLKAHLRPSDEPHDLAYWMVLAVNVSVWLFLMMLPFTIIGAAALLFHGPVHFGAASNYILPLGLAVVLAIALNVVARLITRRETRKLNRLKVSIREDIEVHEALGGHIILSGEDARTQWPKIEPQIRELLWKYDEREGLEG